MSVLCLCYTCFGRCLVLSPMKTVRLKQKIFQSFNCTVSHHILLIVFLKANCPLWIHWHTNYSRGIRALAWYESIISISFKTVGKVRFSATLWLFPSIFLKGRASRGFALISTGPVCALTDSWALLRGALLHCSAPALQSCSQQRSLLGKKFLTGTTER